MILGIYPSIGESLADLDKNGKLERFRDYYLPAYLKKFNKIYLFSYGLDQNIKLPKGCYLIPNKWGIHRYLYTFLMPLINFKYCSQIHISRIMQLDGIFPAIISKLLWRTKFAVTYGYDYRQVEILNRHPLNSFLYLVIEKILLPFSDLIIFSSQTIKNMVSTDPLKSCLIPNGIDMKLFSWNKTKRPNGFNILVQSRLTPEKNLTKFLEFMAKLKIKRVNITIIGRGPLKYELQKLAQKLKVNLNIIDLVPNSDMPKYFNNNDLYIHPSLTEGSPKALIEAAACGSCILVSDLAQTREVLGNNGAGYFDPNNMQGMVDLIENIYKDVTHRKELSLNARRAVVKKFDIKTLLTEETNLLFNLR